MREDYRHQLADITTDLVRMSEVVAEAISEATEALINNNISLADEVIAGDEVPNSLNVVIEDKCFRIAALQAPVATDLRVVMSGLRMASSLERMGDLAVHVAKQVRIRYPESAIPSELHPIFIAMGQAANNIAIELGKVLQTRDVEQANQIKKLDDELDRLHRESFQMLLDPAWSHGVAAAIDVTLLARFYERFGDHAVSVARRIVHIATGEPY
jgi:phosphate transport system protein